VRLYRFIEAEKAAYPVRRMLGLLEVPKSTFYDWWRGQAEPPSPRAQRREELAAAVVAAHADSDGVNGAPRIHADLKAAGHVVARKTVAKIMADLRIQGVSPRPWRVTTVPDAAAAPLPDLVERGFDTGELDRVWISDITYLHTGQGWLYLCAVRDACSRRVLGFALAEHQRAELVTTALAMAIQTRGGRADGVIFHADRGSQFTSREVTEFAAANGLRCSVGATGICWDNAMAESFWATLKVEYYYRHTWPTKAAAVRGVSAWITEVYNSRRRHSALGMRTPLQFELTRREPALAA
jgi:transposase InsO family protein